MGLEESFGVTLDGLEIEEVFVPGALRSEWERLPLTVPAAGGMT